MIDFPPLYLLRHGQTEWNAEGRLQGQMNSDLTEIGAGHARSQGRLLAEVFMAHPDMKIIASPLGRVRQTAQIALGEHDRTPEFDQRLVEVSAGSWEGMTKDDVRRDFPDISRDCATTLELFLQAPDGEGFDALRARSLAVLRELKGPTVIFSHGTTIAVLRALARGAVYKEMVHYDHLQGCIYHIEGGVETCLR